MKRSIFVAALLLFFVGCTQQQTDQLTEQQKDQIKSEVKLAGDSLMAKLQRLDPGWSQYYADSPDWAMLNADGSRYDYQTFAKSIPTFYSALIGYKWTASRQDFIVASKDIVICSWIGKDETSMKSGEKITCDPHAYTVLFKKMAGEWKIVYQHDSGTPVMQKGGKK
jgi:hypothetical protein